MIIEFQLQDFNRIGKQYPICIAGDFNIPFGDKYYFSKDGRDKLNAAFAELGFVNLTESVEKNIDHMVVFEGLVGGMEIGIGSWN